MLVWGGLTAASAQDSSRTILGIGNAVVTGFSGVRPPAGRLPPSVNPIDRTFIDLDRPSARIVNLDALRGPARAQVVQAPKPFSVTAAQIGQVFSIALDDAKPPNIYLAATSAYGLPIVVPDRDGDGRPDRSRRGGPNASFMPGLFGPVTVNGGPGSIWRIDGRTGTIALFANVTLDGVPNSGPALGGLAFDPATRQLFVADRDTGMIHRFGLDGADRGRFDHGTNVLPAAGSPAVPFDPRKRLDLTNPTFDSGNQATWAYAPPQRRIFGLAVRSGRLFYAVAAGLQIWSVAIAPDGGFGPDPRLELNVPGGLSVAEISNVVLDDDGHMILAERGAPTGAYDYQALAVSGENRVLQFRPKRPDDPPSPGLWYPIPEEYAIGLPSNFRNDNGGIAIGYGYGPRGNINRASCGGALWSTGEQLRVARDRAIVARLQRSGPLIVNGLQGNPIHLVRPLNNPPFRAYYIDYDDRFDDVGARGHLGDVETWRVCGRTAAPPRPLTPVLACPSGWFNVAGVCLAGLACPRGTEFANGRCVYRDCPASYVNVRGTCVPPPVHCKNGEIYVDGRCELSTCPPGLVPTDPALVAPGQNSELVPIPPANEVNETNGAPGTYCTCPTGKEPGKDGNCVAPPPPTTPPPATAECQPPDVPQADGTCCKYDDYVAGTCGASPPPATGGCTEFEQLSGKCLTPPPAQKLPEPSPPATGGCTEFEQLSGKCLASPTGPPLRVLPPPAAFCQGDPFKLVNGTCCLGGATCTAKPLNGACGAAEYDTTGWGDTPMCCREAPIGTCPPPTPPPPPSIEVTSPVDACDVLVWVPGVQVIAFPVCVLLEFVPGMCQSHNDCAAGTSCTPEGQCVDGGTLPSTGFSAPSPATGGCQSPSIPSGGNCCTPEAVAAGTCGPPPPPAAGCPAGLFASNDGKTCCTKEEITRETCGSPPPAPQKAKKAKTTTKPRKQEIVCQKGFHQEGNRCVQDSPQPRADPGFSIQFGIGIGGGGGGRPRGGSPSSPPGGKPN